MSEWKNGSPARLAIIMTADKGLQLRAPGTPGAVEYVQALAIEAMVGALLAVEWDHRGRCPACTGPYETVSHVNNSRGRCPVDVALTAAGYPDAASRDAERAKLAEAEERLSQCREARASEYEVAIRTSAKLAEVTSVLRAVVETREAYDDPACPSEDDSRRRYTAWRDAQTAARKLLERVG